MLSPLTLTQQPQLLYPCSHSYCQTRRLLLTLTLPLTLPLTLALTLTLVQAVTECLQQRLALQYGQDQHATSEVLL